MKGSFIVFITCKRSSLRYVFFVAHCENDLQAQLDAWSTFQEEYGAKEEDWVLMASEVSLEEEGPQNVARLD